MNADGAHLEGIANLPRAGFWRRSIATLIDWIIAALPFQILAVVLFPMTAGTVQMDSGLFFRVCAEATTIPQSLDPPPPHDSNFAQVCRISFFGAPTGAILTVGRVTRESTKTTTVTQSYMLDLHGEPIEGISLDWYAAFAFLTYLVCMVWKQGGSLGARIVGVKVVDAAEPSGAGVPIHKAIIRYLAMAIGFVPVLAVWIYQSVVSDGSADAMFTGDFFRWFMYAGLLAALWSLLLIIQVACKRDPVYDRLAGTAVVRPRKIEPAKSDEHGLRQT